MRQRPPAHGGHRTPASLPPALNGHDASTTRRTARRTGRLGQVESDGSRTPRPREAASETSPRTRVDTRGNGLRATRPRTPPREGVARRPATVARPLTKHCRTPRPQASEAHRFKTGPRTCERVHRGRSSQGQREGAARAQQGERIDPRTGGQHMPARRAHTPAHAFYYRMNP